MRLPHGENAHVDDRKLSEYLLNSGHPRGRHKARVFAAALGLTAQSAHVLKQALLFAAAQDEAVAQHSDSHGTRYSVDFVVHHTGRPALVRSLWIVPEDGSQPRFVTAYVLR